MSGVRGLAEYIASVTKKSNKEESTYYGKISGSSVEINSMYYPYSVAVDIPANDGDYVWCILNSSKTLAVVVGG